MARSPKGTLSFRVSCFKHSRKFSSTTCVLHVTSIIFTLTWPPYGHLTKYTDPRLLVVTSRTFCSSNPFCTIFQDFFFTLSKTNCEHDLIFTSQINDVIQSLEFWEWLAVLMGKERQIRYNLEDNSHCQCQKYSTTLFGHNLFWKTSLFLGTNIYSTYSGIPLFLCENNHSIYFITYCRFLFTYYVWCPKKLGPQRPDRHWGPPSLLSNGYRWPGSKTDHSLPSSVEVKNCGATSAYPHMSS
jgi:hypothetical protein